MTDPETMPARPTAPMSVQPRSRKLTEVEILRVKNMELRQRIAELLTDRARLFQEAAELEIAGILEGVADESRRLGLPPKFRVVDGGVEEVQNGETGAQGI